MTLDEIELAPDAFAVFGLPRSLAIDPADLERRYRELTQLTHPDFAGPEPEAQMRAMDLSAKVNAAYATLRNEEERANALLAALGGATKEADKSLPPGFLGEMMTLREALDEAHDGGDAAAVAALGRQAREGRAGRLATVAALLSDPTAEALRAARVELNALRYLERMLEQLEPPKR